MLNVNVTLDLHLSLELGLGFVVGVVSSPNLRRDLLESLQLAKGLAFRVNSDVCCPYERNFGPKDSEEKVMYKQLGPGASKMPPQIKHLLCEPGTLFDL